MFTLHIGVSITQIQISGNIQHTSVI